MTSPSDRQYRTHGLTLAQANEVVCVVEAMDDLRKDAEMADKWAEFAGKGDEAIHIDFVATECLVADTVYSPNPEERARLAEFFRESARIARAKADEIEASFKQEDPTE